MVKKRLVEISGSQGEHIDTLEGEVGKLNTTALHKMKSSETIRRICYEVISAVDTLMLVSVDEIELERRKPKKQKSIPITFTELERIGEMAEIRKEWNTHLWKKGKFPHGWVWHDNDLEQTLLGCMYSPHHDPNQYQIFIRRDIAENPDGAIILIQAMKKKLEKIIPKRTR